MRKLKKDEIVCRGDKVTIYETEDSGFRDFTGILGRPAGIFSYPIYREEVIDDKASNTVT